MQKALTIHETDHLCQTNQVSQSPMLQPHRQHQFHCDTHQRTIDANARINGISLHVPPGFQPFNHRD